MFSYRDKFFTPKKLGKKTKYLPAFTSHQKFFVKAFQVNWARLI
ncbi:hypothetical protein O59_001191 [Cellvibrio sp. BR]|nr:hypothetical protein O59_001191 [Cellvibrio sp. BR]